MSEARWKKIRAAIAAAIKKAAPRAGALSRDALGVAGVGMIVHGVAGWSPPASWIVAGVFALVATALLSLSRSK